MKKEIKNYLKKTILIVVFIFTANLTKAQICPGFLILNNHPTCAIKLSYKIFDVSNCNTVYWNNVTIGPSGVHAIPIGVITGSEDIEVFVTSLVSSTSGPTAVNYGSGSGGGGSWPCYNPTGNPANQLVTGFDPNCFGPYNILATCNNVTIW